MRYSATILALAALASIVIAQQIPSCAQACISNAVKSATSCASSDLGCQCQPTNKAAIQSAASGCVVSSCSSADVASTLAGADAICKALPSSGSSSSSAPASSSIPAPASSSTAPAPAASAFTSVALTTATTLPAAYTSDCKCSNPPSASAVSNSNSTTTTSLLAQFTGAASQLAAGLGSVFAIGIAALAAL